MTQRLVSKNNAFCRVLDWQIGPSGNTGAPLDEPGLNLGAKVMGNTETRVADDQVFQSSGRLNVKLKLSAGQITVNFKMTALGTTDFSSPDQTTGAISDTALHIFEYAIDGEAAPVLSTQVVSGSSGATISKAILEFIQRYPVGRGMHEASHAIDATVPTGTNSGGGTAWDYALAS